MSIYHEYVSKVLSGQEYEGLDHIFQKEILHHDILSSMAEHDFFSTLTFIGGTALRLCYSSARLSEDLDFTGGNDFRDDRLSNFAQSVQNAIHKKYDLPVVVIAPKPDNTYVRTWKINVVTHPNKSHMPAQRINIDIACIPSYSRQVQYIKSHYALPLGPAGILIPTQTEREIFTDKLLALAFRKGRMKGRDLWDIHYLKTRGQNTVIPEITNKIKDHHYSIGEFRTALSQRIEQIKGDLQIKKDFEQEMRRFLPLSLFKQTIDKPEFWAYLIHLIETEKESVFRLMDGKGSDTEQ